METIRNIRNHYKKDIIDEKFKAIHEELTQKASEICLKIKAQIEKEPNVNQISDFLIKL